MSDEGGTRFAGGSFGMTYLLLLAYSVRFGKKQLTKPARGGILDRGYTLGVFS